jgi:Leucine-rich repeat (LRR) protein
MFSILLILGILLKNSSALEIEKKQIFEQGLTIIENEFVGFYTPCNDQILLELCDHPHLKGISFHVSLHTPLPLKKLTVLYNFPYLTKLVLPGIKINEEDAIILTKLANLKFLDLSFCSIDPKALPYLAQLPLTALALNSTNLSDKNFSLLVGLKDSLQELYLNNNGITAKSSSVLNNFTNLTHLTLNRNNFTNQGLKGLNALTLLEHLSLHSSLITDKGMKYLTQFPRLKRLTLSNNFLTTEGLSSLKGLSKLEFVDLQYNSQVTPEAIRNVFSNNNSLKVLYDQPDTTEENDLSEQIMKL